MGRASPPGAMILRCSCGSYRNLLHPLDNRGNALPNADTHGCQAVAPAAPLQLVQEGHHKPCAAAAERVTQRDSPAVDVEFLLVNLKFAHTLQNLHGKGFVQFDQIHILDAEPGTLQNLANLRLTRRNSTSTDRKSTRLNSSHT